MMLVMGMDFLGGQNPESSMDEGHGNAASRKDSSETADGTFKMPDIKKEDIEKTIQNIGDKLKKFKFGN